MLSAMFNLTGMVEDLLLNNGKGRKRPVARADEGLVHTVPLRVEERRGQISGTVVAEPVAVREAEAPVVTSPVRDLPPGKFGSLGRRRRRGALAVLSALLLGLLLVLFLPTLNRDETSAASQDPTPNAAERREPPEERPAGVGTDGADREGGGDPANVAAPDAAPQAESTSPEGDAGDKAVPPDAGGGGIPDVSGRPLEEAATTLSEAGYSVAAIRSVEGPEKYGTVTGTEPSAGTEARPNAPVVLTMSAGPTGSSSATVSPASTSAASASAASSSSASASATSAASTSASPAGISSASASAPASPAP